MPQATCEGLRGSWREEVLRGLTHKGKTGCEDNGRRWFSRLALQGSDYRVESRRTRCVCAGLLGNPLPPSAPSAPRRSKRITVQNDAPQGEIGGLRRAGKIDPVGCSMGGALKVPEKFLFPSQITLVAGPVLESLLRCGFGAFQAFLLKRV